ncbi:Phosphomevalonate kinase [Escovopsis weberi]|uniref:Phosphomevalonate kinase n=1 Tax=Escovopsis weberi TaxID=150374 RepID=A0A0M9VSS4_ESCWE|nr:Phosphomevalonate kinase [Escovopsis weberi]
MPTFTPSTALSAPGKVLLAGGYLVLDQRHTGLVFGLSARISVVAGAIRADAEGVQIREIVVASPQFREAEWRYGYRLAPEGGGVTVTQLQVGPVVPANLFVETTLSYALTYIDHITSAAKAGRGHGITSSRFVILADNDYYSQPEGPPAAGAGASTSTSTSTSTTTAAAAASSRFATFPVPLSQANKTGLGSSAALVTALTAALLTHYLPRELFDAASPRGRTALHNLAQAAHCAAQGKVGSGFDVAAAVFGSCTYRRFSPDILARLPEPGTPGFGAALAAVVADPGWDAQVLADGVALPAGLVLRMCDVTCGSQTVGMVKKVLAWRAAEPDASARLWDDLQSANDLLGGALRAGDLDALPYRLGAVRALIRDMGAASGVPIEPPSQTALVDAASRIDGVYGGVVPGAGGFDAVVLLMRDDEATARRVEDFLADWTRQGASKVKLLGVKGEMEGVRQESLDTYSGWLS